MNLFLDLDGTLLDSKERLYRLFQYLVPESMFSFQEYWDTKRKGIGNEQLLGGNFGYEDQKIIEFRKTWLSMIELPEWLALDKPLEGVTDHLKRLKLSHELYLVTARQQESVVAKQLNDFGWTDFFSQVLVTRQLTEKRNLIEQAVTIHQTDWIIGDTGYDIKTGKELGIRTAAVLNGFQSKECLINYEPDLFLDSILNFKY